MAVGDFSKNGQSPALSEVLTAGHWVVKRVPSPSRRRNMFANEVSCASPASCLLVGDHFAGQRGPTANLAEAWNGRSWRIVTTTGPARAGPSLLTDVACPTTSFCLAVGQAGSGNRAQDTAYTWSNGKTWRQIAVRHPRLARNSELTGVACFTAQNCLAVGNYTTRSGRNLPFAARRHDGRWRLLAPRFIGGQRYTTFQAVSCPAASKCVAVGNTEDLTKGKYFHAFAETWNRGAWHISTLRRQPSLFLGISCPASDRCFAVGYTFPSLTTFAHPLIETWNGRFWTTQHAIKTSAPRKGDILPHVSCAARSDCETVGYRFHPGVSDSDRTLAEKWNGRHWTAQATPNP